MLRSIVEGRGREQDRGYMVKSEPVMYTGGGSSIKGVVPLGRGGKQIWDVWTIDRLAAAGSGCGREMGSLPRGVACKQFFCYLKDSGSHL